MLNVIFPNSHFKNSLSCYVKLNIKIILLVNLKLKLFYALAS